MILYLGRGSVLNSLGEVEMDAVIMEGKSLSAGAIACVQNISNPVRLARMVMEKVFEYFCKYHTKVKITFL